MLVRGCAFPGLKFDSYLHFHVVGILEIAESCLGVKLTTALAYDLTLDEPPAQVQLVDQTRLLPDMPVTVVHCEPEVAADMPQRSWYTVYPPVASESHCPHMVVALSWRDLVGAGEAAARPAKMPGARTESFILGKAYSQRLWMAQEVMEV